MSTARQLWDVLNPLHSIVYWDPEPRDEYLGLGLKGGWRQYFASRSAAVGPVSPSVVVALFYGFSPALARSSLDGLWNDVSPDAVWEARLRGADKALGRRLGERHQGEDVIRAAALARRVAEACTEAGRPLFAAHSGRDWPAAPHVALWLAATLYREYRGDGHVAVLMCEQIDPVESLVLDAATDRVAAEFLKSNRGWSEEEWDAGVERLRSRGLVDGAGKATADGRTLREEIEAQTDLLSEPPLTVLDVTERKELLALLTALRSFGAF